ncbi:MAG: replication-associated recombination protein A [Verrucomicrobiota bacterium]|nr:replication-associated recombination protein A [Verrucomicrobiota bacterium]
MNSIQEDKEKSRSATPLAERMRPKRLEEVRGQSHLLGEDCLLPKLIRENRVGNLILTGPPGTGKTTLATVIAEESECKLIKLNAVTSNVSELRDSLKLAKYYGAEKCYLFVDEIHRFNKSQQDLLLPDIESGEARLIGATTHNPRYYVNDPLLSRSQLFTLQPLSVEEIETALLDCLKDQDKGLAHRECTSESKAINQISRLAEGDLRKAYNILEVIVEGLPNENAVSEDAVALFAKERSIRYDRDEDEHYDTASALIKSMRGNDPDASLYWLAKMLMGGEDPRFIARRLVIFASEDIGLADSRALLMADATFRACETIGLPECELNLAHCVLFLTTCPKSNSATLALAEAKKTIRENPVQSIPSSIQDRHGRNEKYRDKEKEGYLYSHDFPENISGQSYLEKDLEIYKPKSSGAEEKIKDRLKRWHILRSQKRNTERG